jgi:hypothetical protein
VEVLKPGSKVYYIRSALGCLAGALCGLLTFSLHGLLPFQVIDAASMLIAALIYYLSMLLSRAAGVKAEDLNNPQYLKRGGLFTFILLWLMVWSLVSSLLIPWLP